VRAYYGAASNPEWTLIGARGMSLASEFLRNSADGARNEKQIDRGQLVLAAVSG